MKIKICGLTNNRNIRDIALLHPDYMGFIFHESSPRDVSPIIDHLQLNVIPASIRKVAVLVDKPLEKAKDLITKYGFDAIQLHGDEDPGYCRRLNPVCEVIKAFRLKDSLPPQIDDYEGSCNLFLFDAKGKYQGGNSIKFNHEILRDYKLKTPFILSGGIGENDLPYLLNLDLGGLAGVDLNSRFELSAGYKCISSLKDFINKLRSNATVNK